MTSVPETSQDLQDLQASQRPAKPRALGWRGWLLLILLTLLVAIGTWTQLFSVARMVSNSMQPTLRVDRQGADLVLIDHLSLRWREPQRGELVHFRASDGELVMKRVVGLPGETVELRAGAAWVDGKPLSGPPEVTRQAYVNDGHLGLGVQLRVSPGHYLVLGDDSQDSYDSRFWGCLPRAEIRGLGSAIVWPPARIRSLALAVPP